MNIFKRFKKPTPIVTPLSEYEQHEQRLIEGVIEQLKTTPSLFSARWWNGEALDKSVSNKNKTILIMIEDGQITRPLRPSMSQNQKEEIKSLIAPIVVKDGTYIINKLFKTPPPSGL